VTAHRSFSHASPFFGVVIGIEALFDLFLSPAVVVVVELPSLLPPTFPVVCHRDDDVGFWRVIYRFSLNFFFFPSSSGVVVRTTRYPKRPPTLFRHFVCVGYAGKTSPSASLSGQRIQLLLILAQESSRVFCYWSSLSDGSHIYFTTLVVFVGCI
jgi:hypothetical protein